MERGFGMEAEDKKTREEAQSSVYPMPPLLPDPPSTSSSSLLTSSTTSRKYSYDPKDKSNKARFQSRHLGQSSWISLVRLFEIVHGQPLKMRTFYWTSSRCVGINSLGHNTDRASMFGLQFLGEMLFMIEYFYSIIL